MWCFCIFVWNRKPGNCVILLKCCVLLCQQPCKIHTNYHQSCPSFQLVSADADGSMQWLASRSITNWLGRVSDITCLGYLVSNWMYTSSLILISPVSPCCAETLVRLYWISHFLGNVCQLSPQLQHIWLCIHSKRFWQNTIMMHYRYDVTCRNLSKQPVHCCGGLQPVVLCDVMAVVVLAFCSH